MAIPIKSLDELTFRQRMFVKYFLGEANGNATEAARLAKYAFPNVEGPKNLVHPSIKAAIASEVADVGLTADETIARLADHAAGSMEDVISLDKHGNPRLDLAKAKRAGKFHLIKKLKPTKFGYEVELYDAQAALEKLGRYHGLFDKVDLAKLADEQIERLAQAPKAGDGRGDPPGPHG